MAITLTIKDLNFGYNGRPILEEINFSVKKHEILAIIGPNGAGKSTLLKCINGLLKIRKGAVDLDGEAVRTMVKKDIAGCIGYVPQHITATFPLTVFDMVLLGRYPHQHRYSAKKDRRKVLEVLNLLGIEDLSMRNFAKLSGGQKQKVAIARALVQEPKILLLDEPTSNQDILQQLEVFELLKDLVKQKHMSVIMAIHDLNLTARYADIVLLLNKGRIAAKGDPSSVMTSPNISSVYKVDVDIIDVHGKPNIIPISPSCHLKVRG